MCKIVRALQSLVAVSSLFFLGLHSSALSDNTYFIDAHSQVDDEVELNTIIKQMDAANVRSTILAARGQRDWRDISTLGSSYPGRIIPAIRTKGGTYRRNSSRYYRRLTRQLQDDNFSAIAEVLLYHAQKRNGAPEVVVYPKDRRVQAALSTSLDRGWPFVIHIEFASLKGKRRDRFMVAMQKLLDDHKDHPFVLIHMGQLQARKVESLLESHKNIHFMTSHSDPITVSRSSQPWINLFDGSSIKKEWKALFVKHPDRFIFALDNVREHHWLKEYQKKMEYWKKALALMPEEVAQAIAHKNAKRLWRIK